MISSNPVHGVITPGGARPRKLTQNQNRSESKRSAVVAACSRSVRSPQSAEWLPRVDVPGETGQPLRMDNFNARAVRPTLKKAGVPWLGFHAPRRGLASNLVELGADPKIAQAILRHANFRSAMNFCIKARPEKTAEAMANLEKAFRARKPSRRRRRQVSGRLVLRARSSDG